MARPHGKDGCRHTSKESGRERLKKHKGCKKRGQTAKIEGLREVGYEKIGEDERWRGGSR